MQEMQAGSLGQEDPLEKEIATHSSILAWEIPWTEEPVRLQSTGSQRVGHDSEHTHTYVPSLLDLPPRHPPPHTSRSSQSTKLSSLYHTAGSHYLHTVVCICQCYSPSLVHPPLPHPGATCWFSTSLHLYSCSANRFICTTFLDSTCMH